jgi:hypothetical protein
VWQVEDFRFWKENSPFRQFAKRTGETFCFSPVERTHVRTPLWKSGAFHIAGLYPGFFCFEYFAAVSLI